MKNQDEYLKKLIRSVDRSDRKGKAEDEELKNIRRARRANSGPLISVIDVDDINSSEASEHIIDTGNGNNTSIMSYNDSDDIIYNSTINQEDKIENEISAIDMDELVEELEPINKIEETVEEYIEPIESIEEPFEEEIEPTGSIEEPFEEEIEPIENIEEYVREEVDAIDTVEDIIEPESNIDDVNRANGESADNSTMIIEDRIEDNIDIDELLIDETLAINYEDSDIADPKSDNIIEEKDIDMKDNIDNDISTDNMHKQDDDNDDITKVIADDEADITGLMTEEEIEQLLSSAKTKGENYNSKGMDVSEDIVDIIDKMDNINERVTDLEEIGDLLEASDNDELLEGVSLDDGLIDIFSDEHEDYVDNDENQEDISSDKVDKKSKKNFFAKKSLKDGKFNFMDKIMCFLFGDDKEGLDVLELEDMTQSMDEENQDILQILEEEDKADIDSKKANTSREVNDEDIDSIPTKSKNKKEKKEKAPKKIKEKKIREKVAYEKEPRIPLRKLLPIFMISASLLGLCLIIILIIPSYINRSGARRAYENEEYANCYKMYYGKKLNESEQIMYNRSAIILTANRKLEAYNNFMSMDMPVEAINALFESVRLKENILQMADEYGIRISIDNIYSEIGSILNDKYSLSEADVMEILEYGSDVDYNNKLRSIINGSEFIKVEDRVPTKVAKPVYEDVLPEEEDYINTNRP